jgi:hypothetical protein
VPARAITHLTDEVEPFSVKQPAGRLFRVAEDAGLTLEEALRHWSDPAEYSEAEKNRGYRLFLGGYVGTSAYEAAVVRYKAYWDRRQPLEDALRQKLRSSDLTATALAAPPTIASRREAVSADLWQVAQFDFEKNEVTAVGLRLVEIRIFEPVRPEAKAVTTTAAPIGAMLFAVEDEVVYLVADRPLPAAASRLFRALLIEFEEDETTDRRPDGHRFVEARELCRRLIIEEPALRQLVKRTRESIEETMQAARGTALRGDAFIETRRWEGYRLNPRLVKVRRSKLQGFD